MRVAGLHPEPVGTGREVRITGHPLVAGIDPVLVETIETVSEADSFGQETTFYREMKLKLPRTAGRQKADRRWLRCDVGVGWTFVLSSRLGLCRGHVLEDI